MRATCYECKHLAWAVLWVVSAILLAFVASLAPASKSTDGFGVSPAFAACDTCGTGTTDHDPTGPDRP
jgi:hypothetical protein